MTPMISEQLPHLLHLMDDPTPVVREEVRKALINYGHFLRPATRDWIKEQHEDLRQEWDYVCQQAEAKALQHTWLSWMLFDRQALQLEAAMLSLEMGGSHSTSFIQASLDKLEEEFTSHYDEICTDNLLEFIFEYKEFDKTLRDKNYLQHRLGYVLRYQRGSQLGLGILAVILADRVGLELSLVRIQGNWLILDQSSQSNILYNPEHHGAMLLRSEAMCLEEAYRRDLLLADELAASTIEILDEVIESHLEGYKRSGLTKRESEMAKKLQILRSERERRDLVGFLASN